MQCGGRRIPSHHDLTVLTIEQLIALYESWIAAEPGKGYAEKAAEWRAKWDELQATKPRSDAATEGKDDPSKP